MQTNSGDKFVWLSGAALAVCLLMVLGLFALVIRHGAVSFWPSELTLVKLADGSERLGQIVARESMAMTLSEGQRATSESRIELRQGNRDIFGEDFVWIPESTISSMSAPKDAVLVERLEWGNFVGYFKGIHDGERTVVEGDSGVGKAFHEQLTKSHALSAEILHLTKSVLGEINTKKERIRLSLKGMGASEIAEADLERFSAEARELFFRQRDLSAQYQQVESKIAALKSSDTLKATFVAVGGQEKILPLSEVVRAYQPNSLGVFGKFGIYLDRIGEFVGGAPRESNTEGGVFPAIFGTIMVVVMMSVIVTPLGVLAAIYLREYAKQGRFVSLVRVAVNNLAGVPSIVFGVFGVGFFIYGLGGSIDQLFFADALPTPTYGTGGILWASLTLALLTVPTVIVATEEGLASIPKHLREASYALGATKFETTWRVVLPSLAPSILTGVILAVARAAGEVAPLMITGVVKLAPSLPVDGTWPFVHFDRKFMHLGFHIFDVGFQSPNVDAARPMVYTTTLLLLLIVICLNLSALVLRNRLRKRFATSAV